MSWLNDGGFLESSRNPGSIFLDEKLNDLLLYSDLPQQNILFGTNQSNLSSLKMTSNMTIFNYNLSIKDALGLGNSNLLRNSTLHKFVMTGPSNSVDSPNIGIYTDDDSNNPRLQIHNNQRDDLAIGFDAYKDNSNIWKSSDTHANFAMVKKDGCFNLWNASGVPRGSSNMNWRVALAVNSNSFIGIGASNRLAHRVNIIGDPNSTAGPNMAFYTTASEHPLYQMLHHDNNNITHSYDSYSWDNRWISSTSNGNFRIAKSNGLYGLYCACNVPTSSNITWTDAFIVKDDGRINMGNTTAQNSLYRLNVVGQASNLTQGPHLGFYLSNTLIVQLLNYAHDDIQWGFDTHWNGSNWINVDKGAFRIAKSNSTFGIHSSCNMNSWESAFTIGADSRIGIGTNNRVHRININGDHSLTAGPNIGFYSGQNALPMLQMLNLGSNNMHVAMDAYWTSSNWISTGGVQGNFLFSKSNGLYSIFTACNIQPGSNITAWKTTLVVGNDGRIGIGGSNMDHKLTMRARRSNTDGPHMAFYIQEDPLHPLVQHRNWDHNEINYSLDAYWSSNRWISSDSNANYRFDKTNTYTIWTACNVLPGQEITSWQNALSIHPLGNVGIGGSNSIYRFALEGPAVNVKTDSTGPHMAIFLTGDSNPVFQHRNRDHDDVSQSIDAYWSFSRNKWISSDSKANFIIEKTEGKYTIYTACNVLPGDVITNKLLAFAIHGNSFIGIGTNDPTYRFTMVAPSNSTRGPHLAFYTDDDLVFPLYQMRNLRRDDISHSYDAYWTTGGWIAGNSNVFRVAKSNGTYGIYSSCNNNSNVSWRNAFIVGGDTRITMGGGAGRAHRLNIVGDRNSLTTGPNMAFYVSNLPPMLQVLNLDHNNINTGMDAYWDGSNWLSSVIDGNFRVAKSNGVYGIYSSCNVGAGGVITWKPAFLVGSDGRISVGGAQGAATTWATTSKLVINGPISNLDGPHVTFNFHEILHPVVQHVNMAHDAIYHGLDAYWNFSSNEWTSSDSNANFRVAKADGRYVISTACNVAPGQKIDWLESALTVDRTGFIGIGGSNQVTHKLTMRAPQHSSAGPHEAIYVLEDSNHPLNQRVNMAHDAIYHGLDAYWNFNSNQWTSSDSNANFRVAKADGRYVISTACNVAPGQKIDWHSLSALTVDRTGFIGIGGSSSNQVTHKLTMRAPQHSSAGPHEAIYVLEDSNHPLNQRVNIAHDAIYHGLDAYWNFSSNEWTSSDSNANFRVAKADGRYVISTACNVAPGQKIDWHSLSALTVDRTGFIGIGGSSSNQVTHKLTMRAPQHSSAGPHEAIYVLEDSNHPLNQRVNMAHDAIYHGLDAYWNFSSNEWTSSDSNANFRVAKADGRYVISTACNVAPGNPINSWATAFMINRDSFVCLGGNQPTHRFTMRGPGANNIAGPHMAFYVDGSSNPVSQFLHNIDNISTSYDCYINDSGNWTSSSSNGNFRLAKTPNTLGFYYASNVHAGAAINNWTTGLSIASDGRIGIGGHSLSFFNAAAHPALQILNMGHDNTSINFDSYFRDGWLSSSTSGHFRITKSNGFFGVYTAAPGTTAGTPINTWVTPSIMIDSRTGYLGLHATSAPEYAVDIHSEVFYRSNVHHDAHVLPNSNSTYDLGSYNRRWKNLYMSGNAINMNDLILKKDDSSGGLQVYNNTFNAVARVWVKEILVGDPTNAVNSNVVLIKATQTGLNFENITEAISQSNQDPISLVPYLYQNGPNFGLNVKDPIEALASLGTFSMSNFGKIIMYTSNNRLGLNTAVPTETLTIGGNMSLSNNTGKIALHTSNNNLGVGIVTPSARLQVAGDLLAGYSYLGNNSAATGGPFFHHRAWNSNASASHTISYPQYCFGDNSAGNLYIQVSNKSTVVSKIANIHLSFLKRAGVAIDLFTVMLHKSATMTTLSVSSNLNDIVINTDSDCFIAWTTIGSY